MKLKSSLDLERFFTAVRHCQGRVTFETEEGDSLNLKSALCLFVFTAASQDRKSTRLNSSHANESRMPSSA